MELAGIDVASLTRLLAQSANYSRLAETAALVRNLEMSSRYDGGMAEVNAASRVPLSGPAGRRVLAHRGELRALLRRHGVTNPEIFGSAARGDDREDSDVDILVDFAPGTSIIGIQRELRDLLWVRVDLVPRNGLKERVRARAEKDLLPL